MLLTETKYRASIGMHQGLLKVFLYRFCWGELPVVWLLACIGVTHHRLICFHLQVLPKWILRRLRACWDFDFGI